MAKVTIKSIVEGGCSSRSCFHNHTGVCAITDTEHMEAQVAIMMEYLEKKPANEKWECTRYENERSKR